jgi:hypothetical protein
MNKILFTPAKIGVFSIPYVARFLRRCVRLSASEAKTSTTATVIDIHVEMTAVVDQPVLGS